MRRLRVAVAAALMIGVAAAGCADTDSTGEEEPWAGWYASEVISFEPGEGAGFNEDRLPDIVLGPPDGSGGTTAGTMEVLSLGDGGEIVVGFGDRVIVDGQGDDFIVYENAFWESGDPDRVWAELGEVSVSEDGEQWHTFECDYELEEDPPYHGCAGWTPTLDYAAEEVIPPDPEVTGGDAFDLGEIGVERARYVRIRDVWGQGGEPTQGFDLDAVGVVNGE